MVRYAFSEEFWHLAMAFSGVLSFALFVFAEILPHTASSDENSSSSSSIGISSIRCTQGAVVSLVFAGYAEQQLGYNMFPDNWKLFQPMAGGEVFILLQFIGWLMYGSVMVIAVLALVQYDQLVTGMLFSMAPFALASSLLLRASIARFNPEAPAREYWFTRRLVSRSSNLVAILCLATTVMVSVLIDFIDLKVTSFFGGTLIPFTGIFVSEMFVLYGDVLNRGNWSALVPWKLRGGFSYLVLRTCALTGLFIAAFLAVVVFAQPHLQDKDASARTARPAGGIFVITFLAAFSVGMEILALDSFDSQATLDLFRSLRVSRTAVCCLLLSLFCTFFGIGAEYAAWDPTVLVSNNENDVTQTAVASSSAITVAAALSKIPVALPATLIQFLVAPTIHWAATHTYPRIYILWQPFEGGIRYIVLQALGWMVYSISMLFTLLFLISRRGAAGGHWFISIAVLLGDFLIFASTSLFDPERVGIRGERQVPDQRNQNRSAAGRLATSKEILTSALFLVSGIILFAIGETLALDYFRPAHIVGFASLLLFASVPLAYSGGKAIHEHFPLWQPFSGGADFIILQALGWSLYGLMFPLVFILILNLERDSGTIYHSLRTGTLTLCAGFSIFPYMCIVVSLYLYRTEEGDIQALQGSEAVARDAARLLAQAKTPFMRHALIDIIRENDGERYLPLSMRVGASVEELEGAAAREGSANAVQYLCSFMNIASIVIYAVCELLNYLLPTENKWAYIFPLCAVACAGSCLACGVLHGYVGQKKFPDHYRLWQPFHGGENFVILQTFCWVFLSLELFVTIVVTFSDWNHLLLGSFLLLALLGFTSNTLMMMSLSQFDPGAATADHLKNVAGAVEPESFLRRNAEWGVGALLTLSGISMFIAIKMVDSNAAAPLVSSAPAMFLSIMACFLGGSLAMYSIWKQRHYYPLVAAAAAGGSVATTPLSAQGSPRRRFGGDGTSARLGPDGSGQAGQTGARGLLEMVLFSGVILTIFVNEVFNWVNYWLLLYGGLTLYLVHVGALLFILRQEQGLREIFYELQSEIATFFVYSFHTGCNIFWIYAVFVAQPVSITSFASYAVVLLISTTNRLGLPLGKAVAAVNFLYTCSATDIPAISRGFKAKTGYLGESSSGIDRTTTETLVNSSRLVDLHLVTSREPSTWWFLLSSLYPMLLSALLLSYCYTYSNEDLMTGSRIWPRVRRMRVIWDRVAHYFSLSIKSYFVPEPTSVPFNDRKKLIFSYHPHGVSPFSLFWLPLTTLWEMNQLPGMITVHVASVLLAVPLLRDVLLWLGVSDGTEWALDDALDRSDGILLVPGGVSEMMRSRAVLPDGGAGTEDAIDKQSISLVARHKGMFRLALEHGADLVPIFTFGETEILRLLPLPPSLHNWLLGKFGFGLPQFPVGRLLLPFPRKVNLTTVVGKRIVVKRVEDPKPSEIHQLHQVYYAELEKLFDQHKAACGYGNTRLKIISK